MAFNVSYVYKAVDNFTATANKIANSVKKIERNADKATLSVRKFGKSTMQVGRNASLFITAPLVLLGKSFINAASDAEETQSRFDFVFSQVQKKASKSAMVLAKSYNFSRREAQALTANLGDFAQNLGFSQDKSLELAFGLNKLAADVASFKNVQGGAKQVSLAFQSALVGEREALKTLGVAINEEMVKNQIRIMQMRGVRFETKLQAKALATIELLQKNFSTSVGDTARTFDSHTNKGRRLKAQYDDMSVTLGQKLIPVHIKLMEIILKLINKFNEISPATQRWILYIGILAAVLAPIILSVGAIIFGIGLLAKGMIMLGGVIGMVAGAMRILTIVFMLNPFGLVVTAVTATIAGIIYLRKEIAQLIKNIIEWFSTKIPDWIKNFLGMKEKEIKFTIDENKLVKVEGLNGTQSLNAKLDGDINIRTAPDITVGGASSKLSGMNGNLGINMNNLYGATF